MKIIPFPARPDWPALLARPTQDFAEIEEKVAPILQRVKAEGDAALRDFARQFDKVELDAIAFSPQALQGAESQLDDNLKAAIRQAYQNIRTFHEAQRQPIEKIETMPGVACWRRSVGIDKVGVYIPGGTAPLFSTVLMLGIPAQLAGCREVILCTPSDHPAILYAAQLVGVTKAFRIGGAQAIAAMAYGTESVPKVYKIFGPGNQYVTAAKMLVSKEGMAIDMPAGPSEVAVYADDTAIPAFVAADLLSQAEHGADSQVLLVSTSRKLISSVNITLSSQLEALPRRDLARQAIANSKAILVNSPEEAVDLLNEYAAEHLILSVADAEKVSEQITNAGSIFLGNYTPESCGDYASGTNHTLPTNGFARAYSGVSLDSFVKKITVQHISEVGIKNLGPTVEIMAEAESLLAHKKAVSIRLNNLATSSPGPFSFEEKGSLYPSPVRRGTKGEVIMFDLKKIIRPHILNLTPYSSARDEYTGQVGVFLDANENPLGSVLPENYNRYPDPHQRAIKEKLAPIKGVNPNQIFLGNGSDEAIDLLIRATCVPGQDSIIILPPTYGMYEVSASINDVALIKVPLAEDYQLNTEAILASSRPSTKIIWVCSPNNPSGNLVQDEGIESLLKNFDGLVVVDEAYIDFADTVSWTKRLAEFPNLVVLQTFSKAWGLASLRLGMCFASPELIAILDKIKPPYNLGGPTQALLYKALDNESSKNAMVRQIRADRATLINHLNELPTVVMIHPSDANFLLVQFKRASATMVYLIDEKIIVRDRSKVTLCDDCLRITVGTAEENVVLVEALRKFV